jgi:hypothetical protein
MYVFRKYKLQNLLFVLSHTLAVASTSYPNCVLSTLFSDIMKPHFDFHERTSSALERMRVLSLFTIK